ncbi:hypothetical protein ACH4E8_13580 [Streptomyces sp. NPDC017979]|uniref:hypothetical protein n=1 Tax=Streptomyces sp. NPDC017979 TaxID=3365024 RepID=UPI0037AFECFE
MAVNRRTSLSRSAAAVFAVGTMAAGTLAAGGTAQAAPAASGSSAGLAPSVAAQHTFTLPKGVTSYRTGTGAARTSIVRTPAQAQLNINCTLTASNPFRYWGGPYGGGVQGIASVSCTGAVQQISVTVGLYRYNSLVSVRTRSTYGNTIGGATTEYPYSAGQYQTGAVGTVYFPAGYNPPSGSFPQVNSAVVTIL